MVKVKMSWWAKCLLCTLLLLAVVRTCGCTYNICIGKLDNNNSKTTTTTKAEKVDNLYIDTNNVTDNKGGGTQMNMAFFGIYGQILQHLAVVIGLGILIVCLAIFGRKWLGTLGNFLPKKLFVYVIALAIFAVRALLTMAGLWVFPIGELLIDSVLAVMVAQEIYTIILKRKLFVRD